jgi:glycosidase
VREAVHDILRFWLGHGVSGFRMDVINLISKDQNFPNAEIVRPGHIYQPGHSFYANGPRLNEYLHEIKTKVLDHYDTMTVGETPFVDDVDEMVSIVHGDTGFLNMIFYFELMDIDTGPLGEHDLKPWTVKDLKRIMNKWQKTMIERGGWNALYLENHDQPRSLSHFCDDSDEYRETCAKLLALMHLTLSGTVYVYQGQELGMRNMPKTWDIMTEFKDVRAINYWKKAQERYRNQPERLKRAEEGLRVKARDNARTPVQWDATPNAGFCPVNVKPWMRVNDDYKTVNAEAQLKSDGAGRPSVWHFWQEMIQIRKRSAQVLVYGDFQMLDDTNEDVFAYKRVADSGETWITVLNFTGKDVKWSIPEDVTVLDWVMGNYHGSYSSKPASGTITLNPWEALAGRDGK